MIGRAAFSTYLLTFVAIVLDALTLASLCLHYPNTMKKTSLHGFTALLLIGSLQWFNVHHNAWTPARASTAIDSLPVDTTALDTTILESIDTAIAPEPAPDQPTPAELARKQARKDSLINVYTTETFKERLNRREQLAILDSYLPDQIDFQAILLQMMDSMSTDQKYELMTSVYRRANMPVPALEPVAKIYWKDIEYNFGVVPQGRVVKYTFEFTNIGKIPYQIEEIEGSCGCTIASYPKESILPGQKGKVVVTFDSSGKSGENTELVTVVGNSYPERVVLLINATVR